MIKAAAQLADGTPLLIIGLSRGNCDLLLVDRPITIDVGEMYRTGGAKAGLPHRLVVMVVGGETEDAIANELLAKVGVAEGPNLQADSDEPHVPIIALLARVRALAHKRRDEELLAILGEA